jgi:hypothetical protein
MLFSEQNRAISFKGKARHHNQPPSKGLQPWGCDCAQTGHCTGLVIPDTDVRYSVCYVVSSVALDRIVRCDILLHCDVHRGLSKDASHWTKETDQGTQAPHVIIITIGEARDHDSSAVTSHTQAGLH